MSVISHHGKASSFADPGDVRAFRRWKRIYLDEGYSEQRAEELAFAHGDNGVGLWNDDTSEGSGPSCALPPEDMEERWGGSQETHWKEAKHKLVDVTIGEVTKTLTLKDRMPHKRNITNGAIIDLNPDAIRAFGKQPGNSFMEQAMWSWNAGEPIVV